MPEMHLSNPEFTYSSCGPFTKIKERIKKVKETEESRYIYQYELDKPCLQHDMAYEDFKDLNRRTSDDKVLREKALNIAKNPKHDRYQRELASMVYKFFDKKSSGSGIKNKNISNKELVVELHKPIIRTFSEKRHIHLLTILFRMEI